MRLLVALCSMLVGVQVVAAESCPVFQVNFSAITVDGEPAREGSGPAVCAAALALWNAWDNSTTDRQARGATWNGTGCVGIETRNCSISSGACGAWNSASSWAVTNPSGQTMACPVDACDQYAGKTLTQFQNFPSGLPNMGTSVAVPSAGGCGASISALTACTLSAGGGTFCGVTYKYTGDAPVGSPPAPSGTDGSCAYVDGKQNCALAVEDDGEQCATLAGERMCFEFDYMEDGGPSPGSCWSTDGGGLLCADNAPVTDSEGNAVAPTTTITTTNTTNEYYSSSSLVVAGATTPPVQGFPGGSSNPATPSTGGSDLTKADLFGDEEPTDEAFETQLPTAPTVGSETIEASGISATGFMVGGGGSCPEPATFQFLGNTVEFPILTHLCSLAGMLAPLMLISAWIGAALIVSGSFRS